MEERRRNSTPQETAERLANSLDENTSALKTVKRRYRWVLGFVVALAFVFVLTLKFNYDENVSRCETGNELRTEMNEKNQALADLLTSAGTGDTPDGLVVINIFDEDFVLRDCSDVSLFGQ